MRSGYGGLKIFCGQPTLPTHPVPYLVTKTNIYHIHVHVHKHKKYRVLIYKNDMTVTLFTCDSHTIGM